MNPNKRLEKFKQHLRDKGLFYALWRGMKYFIFLTKKREKHVKAPSRNMISSKRLEILFSNNGINIIWDHSQLTKGIGLNVAVKFLGLWTNSSRADWQIIEKSQSCIRIKAVFKDLPLSLIWSLDIKDEQLIYWKIDLDIEEWLHLDEFRILAFVESGYKTWISNYKQADFPRLNNDWQDFLDNDPASLVGVRFPVEGKNLSSFILETHDAGTLSLIQNPPSINEARLVGFRNVIPLDKKDFSPGQYHLFSGKIQLFVDDQALDKKIENFRIEFFEKMLNGKVDNKKPRRKLKVLLVNLPWQKNDKRGVRAGSRWPHIKDLSEDNYMPFPFFLAYATSLLQKFDIDAQLIDCIAQDILEDKFLEDILSMNLDYLVAETSIPSFYDDLNILKKISTAGIPIILCGPNSEIYKPRFLEEHPFIKLILCGEYEFTLLDLIKTIQEAKDLSKVKGIIYNDCGNVKKNPAREAFDINLLPWPHRETLPMHKYLDAPGEMLTPSVQMVASRGCPFRCQFCLWPQVLYKGNHYRARDVLDVVDEMEYLVKDEGFKSVYFDDDTFNIGKERMTKLCLEIRNRGLDKTQWAIMARPDLMDEEMLLDMKDSGLWAVKYGVESAVQSLVDNIKKNMDLKKAEKMIRFTKELGIKVHLTFTFGLPQETKRTINQTIKFAQELDPFSVQFSITTPFPGTEYYEALGKKGLIISKDFSDYDGQYKSVIKLENLTPRDLEIAKQRANKLWSEHLRMKRGVLGQVNRFCYYSKTKGIAYSLNKTLTYFKDSLEKK